MTPNRQQLVSDLELVTRVERVGGVRERTALAFRVDDWVTYDAPLPTALQSAHGESGFQIDEGPPALWLLPGARVLTLGAAGDVSAADLADADLDLALLAQRLRRTLLAGYLGGGLEAQPPAALPGRIHDLLNLAWEADVPAREEVYAYLASVMRPGPGWDEAAVRIKAGFERGLNDRSGFVRELSARALLAMGLGQGPRTPALDPGRVLRVLFAVPEPDVHRATMTALMTLDDDRLQAIKDVLEPLLQQRLTDPQPETRSLASRLETRLEGRRDAEAVAEELASDSALRRQQALQRLAREPGMARVMLPGILEALTDHRPRVQEAAVAAVRSVFASDPSMRPAALGALLASEGGTTVAWSLTEPEDLSDPALHAAMLESLGAGLGDVDRGVALLMDHYEDRAATLAVEQLTDLLHHPAPEIRLAVLRRLRDAPPGRPAVRDELLQPITDLLHHDAAEVRSQAAETIVELGYPHAPSIVKHLAFDPDRQVRRHVMLLVPATEDPAAVSAMARITQNVDRLFALAPAQEGDERLQWLAALDALGEEDSPFVDRTLAALLASIPPDTPDEFLRQAVDEIDEQILGRVDEAEDLLVICRSLLDGPPGSRQHAARLAGHVADREPTAFDFLWTLYTQSTGTGSEAARRALAGLSGRKVTDPVRTAIQDTLAGTEDAARRDVLRTLLANTQ